MNGLAVSLPLIAALAGAVVVLLIAGWFISTSNRLERQKVKIAEADSGIDVALTKRFDTLTKMFDIAQGYLSHEQQTVLGAVRLRQNMPLPEKAQAAAQMTEAARQISLAVEAYPQLGSLQLYVQLQRSVVETEEHLQAARRLYNSNVSSLNQLVVTIPSSIVAAVKGVRPAPMFEADPARREDVDLSF